MNESVLMCWMATDEMFELVMCVITCNLNSGYWS